MPLKRTESLIFESPNTNLNASVPPTLVYLPSTTLNQPPVSNNDSASTWVSLVPTPEPILPKSLNGLLQYSSPLGPSPRKLYRRTYLHSLPKPNLYRRALTACAKKAGGCWTASGFTEKNLNLNVKLFK
jgi:hypothetical protein